MLRPGDIFGMDRVPIDVGSTRPGITEGLTIYFFDPAGNRNEVFAAWGSRVRQDFRPSTGGGPSREGWLPRRPRAQRRLHQRLHAIKRA